MEVAKKYKFIYKIKNSRDPRVKKYSEVYLKDTISRFLEGREVLKFKDLKTKKVKKTGIYLLYSIFNDKLKFCYIGESTDVYKRFRQHASGFLNGKERLYLKMRNRVKNINDISFLMLDEIDDQNTRLKKETYYIYIIKSRFFSLNSKLVNRRLRCPSGHGMVKSFMTYNKNSEKLKLLVYGKCRNKTCKINFILN